MIDELGNNAASRVRLDSVSPGLSVFGFAELRRHLGRSLRARLLLPSADLHALGIYGGEGDRPARNRLQIPYLARDLAQWLREKVDLRFMVGPVQQGLMLVGGDTAPRAALSGACALTTPGLGLLPQEGFALVHAAVGEEELRQLAQLFEGAWARQRASAEATRHLLGALDEVAAPPPPALVYARVLDAIFGEEGGIDEERVLRGGTGLQGTTVWKKLYRFQRDGVLGAIDKLERFGGCILADSVGLGKTFEALAVIKYYELRNDRVLVLCPKRLRDNWTQYRANDRRNLLAGDRLNYDVLNHTDLGRDGGKSGDIDLAHINWGNYDLVVIDESHNFRNKPARRGRESRYDLLMRRIIQEGVKTRVLMLSATPVNNRLADLKNQIAFITEGQDTAMAAHGITSIEATTRLAQGQFNLWLKQPEEQRNTGTLLELLGFDYFKLLDLLTIARSRRHIERYYGTGETGRFPERNRPINVKAEVDRSGQFRSISEVNQEIRRLNLSVYAPMRYLLPHKKKVYEARYSTSLRGGRSQFQQSDREESLIHLLRVNVLKRMESSVRSFVLTLERLMGDVERTLVKLQADAEELTDFDLGALDPSEIDLTDPRLESLLVGDKVRVLLADVDRLRWRQDLEEDRDRLGRLLGAARAIDAARDAKLAALRAQIEAKLSAPFNPGNRKVLIFSAFTDTATYLYGELESWASGLGLNLGLVTGGGRNRSTLPGLRTDMSTLLAAFSPRSKERPPELASEGELDLLIATDCISEGQNLQDCDTVINYDIHWNPVRIIQRFGRIDRLGSHNQRIQLINFWPNLELDEYINLEQRVAGRMVLLDVSATGEENLIEQAAGDPMNDLEYRRRQLIQLQDRVVDIEDVGVGLTLADLTLSDLRVDLARARKTFGARLDRAPPGLTAAVTLPADSGLEPGVLFCLRAVGDGAEALARKNDPLAPYLLVGVCDDGRVTHPHTQPKGALEVLKGLCAGRDEPDTAAVAQLELRTRGGESTGELVRALSAAVASVVGKEEERGIASLFAPGGTHVLKGEFSGMDDIEVVAAVVVSRARGAA